MRPVDAEIAKMIGEFYEDPLGYVMFAFPWDTDPEIQLVELEEPWKSRFNCQYGPDRWACEFLDDLGRQIKQRGFDGKNAVKPIRFSTASGHGIGKSTLVAWIVMFIMDTRPFCKGTVTANTADQLKSKTWAELGKWKAKCITGHLYDYSATRGSMKLSRKGFDKAGSWFVVGQTCKEENAEAFAGQHAANSTSFYIFDEASGIPDKIFEVREGGTTDGEPMTFDFGNPTQNSGTFFENCVGRTKHRYTVRMIDSRSVAITNKNRIQEWVDDFGEESDFVKVRVRGMFPSAASTQFIAREDVEAGMARPLVVDRNAPLVIGVDVARFGDDETVIFPRVGMDARSWPAERYRGLDTVAVAGKVVEMIRRFRDLGLECSGLFVDGGGIGGGVVDQLRALGYNVIEVQFGGSPIDKTTYRFRVDEMWGRMREAIKTRLILPLGQLGGDLMDQLTKREYGYTISGNKINLESKEDMKERLGKDFGSPDLADALALTFAQDVAPLRLPEGASASPVILADYDPMKFA